MTTIAAVSTLVYSHGLWLGTVPTRYGEVELVLDGTPDTPAQQQVAAIQAFMPQAGEMIHRLRRRLPVPFLWRPVRLAPNDKNQVGVQFQHRIFNRRELLFADDTA
jgi:hypothetical protein